MVAARPLAVLASIVALGCGGGSDSEPDANDIDPGDQDPVPTSAGEMFTYLQGGAYTEFAAESSVHTSAAPHGAGGVRTYLNALLFDSLEAESSEHPVGAAAIKELYASDGVTVSGWAAEVKTATGSGGGTWYWYEVFSVTDGSNPIEGNGNSVCTGCHSTGSDYVRVPFPLQ